MADVLALDAFAHSHFYNHHTIHIPSQPVDCSPKVATGGPVYYRQHEVIQLVEVPAPPPAKHPSTITSSSVPSSSAYTESCAETSESEEEDSEASSYCSSEEGDEAARACYDDTYGTRLSRVLAWRDGFAKALGVALSGTRSFPFAPRGYFANQFFFPLRTVESSSQQQASAPSKRRMDDGTVSRCPSSCATQALTTSA